MGWTVPWYSVPQDAVDGLIADRYFGILVCYLRHGDRVYETYWTTGRGNELMAPSYGLLDLTVYGRQELWEDSPEGWPQRWSSNGDQFRLDGRPTAQWPRIRAGRNDDLGPNAGRLADLPVRRPRISTRSSPWDKRAGRSSTSPRAQASSGSAGRPRMRPPSTASSG